MKLKISATGITDCSENCRITLDGKNLLVTDLCVRMKPHQPVVVEMTTISLPTMQVIPMTFTGVSCYMYGNGPDDVSLSDVLWNALQSPLPQTLESRLLEATEAGELRSVYRLMIAKLNGMTVEQKAFVLNDLGTP